MLTIGLMTLILASCQKQDEVSELPMPEPEKDYVLADLALSLPAASFGTRMSEEVVQTNSSDFRGIQRLSIIPFSKQGKVDFNDMPTYYEVGSLFDQTEVSNEVLRYYNKVALSQGVASFLTYGQATRPSNADKASYGSLVAKVEGQKQSGNTIPDRVAVAPSNLTFELEPIRSSTATTAEARAIAGYMTVIAESRASSTVRWDNSENELLKKLYRKFVNLQDDGVSISYECIAGSSANIKANVNQLYKTLVENPFGDGTPEKAIADNIMLKIRSFTTNLDGTFDENAKTVTSLGSADNYPGSLGLPDCAAVLRWGRTQEGYNAFIPQTETTTLANINSIDRYAYPPELYYYGNSVIKASNKDVESSAYSGKDWATVMADASIYPYDNAVVSSNTKAVAIKEPLQYAVAHLQATLKANQGTVMDNGNPAKELVVTGVKFPVTGIIISGQYPVNYDFTSRYDDVAYEDERFVYDTQLKPGDTFYLTITAQPFHTLVLQGHDNESVTVILELENKSGEAFEGLNGTIYPNTKFYLVGKIKLNTQDATEDYKKRVFTQDYTTEADMIVKTFANAYNVMPNIQTSRLEVGVEVELKWTQAQPFTFEFDE